MEMPEFYRELDLLLITSMFEAHPLILYESMACGTPVVLFEDLGDARVNNLTGVAYYQEYDLDIIKNTIELAMKHRDELSTSAVNCIREKWTWDKIKPQYVKMYQEASGLEDPEVLFVINERNWSWDYMYREIDRYVYPCDVLYVNEKTKGLSMADFSEYDIILNHVWFFLNKMHFDGYPTDKEITSLNGPSYRDPANIMYLRHILQDALGYTTVSLPIRDELQMLFPGIRNWYATRGIDTSLFCP
jgi:hypothetical protein